MSRFKLLAAASGLALTFAHGANAADAEAQRAPTPLDPLVVSATRSEKPVSEVPATVSVITAQDIEDNLATDIKDLVRYEPGVSARTNPARFGAVAGGVGRDGNSGFNIRGLEGNRVLIQVDGVRAPDAYNFIPSSFGRGDYGDLDLIKSVEILRGPASALYGSDGVAGAVTFVTKDPSDFIKPGKSMGAQAKAAYSSADEATAFGGVGAWRSGKLSGMLAYTRRDGHETETMGTNTSANSDRTVANPQDIQSNAVLLKFAYEPSDAHHISLAYQHSDRDVDTNVLSNLTKIIAPAVPTGSNVIGLTAHDENRQDRVSLSDRYVGSDGLVDTAHWTAYYQLSKAMQSAAEDRAVSADRTRVNNFDNKVYGLSADAQTTRTWGGIENTFVYGVDYSRTHQVTLRTGTVATPPDVLPSRAAPVTNYTLAGVFIQDEIKLFDGKLSLYPAVRFDSYKLVPEKGDPLFTLFTPTDQKDSRVSPKLGAVFKASENFNLFLNYAQGFKAPTAQQVNEAFFNLSIGYKSIPNPNLKPETSESWEGGLRWSASNLSLSATGFSAEYEDFIDQVILSGSFTPADPAIYQYVNLTRVKIRGLEGKAQYQFGHGFGLIVAASFAHGDQYVTATTMAPLESIDPVKLVAGLTYASADGRYGGQVAVTHSEGKAADRVVTPGATFRPPGFDLIDLTAYWNITPAVTLRGGVFNLTDEKYWWWGDVRGQTASSVSLDAYTQPGRNFAVSLISKF